MSSDGTSSDGMSSGERYRGVTVADDGTVLGERHLGDDQWVRFQASLSLLWIRWACETSPVADEQIWALQDGYGPAGFTPPQGWDWSGIRDSTPAAVAAMLAVAREHLPDAVVAARLGVPLAVLRDIVERPGG